MNIIIGNDNAFIETYLLKSCYTATLWFCGPKEATRKKVGPCGSVQDVVQVKSSPVAYLAALGGDVVKATIVVLVRPVPPGIDVEVELVGTG